MTGPYLGTVDPNTEPWYSETPSKSGECPRFFCEFNLLEYNFRKVFYLKT